MEGSFLFFLLSYTLTPTLSQREREFTSKFLPHLVKICTREFSDRDEANLYSRHLTYRLMARETVV